MAGVVGSVEVAEVVGSTEERGVGWGGWLHKGDYGGGQRRGGWAVGRVTGAVGSEEVVGA